MQSPSSLIFLVLLAVWAAYFVQYWIRRRDHLATARSVEQFSAAMRVLERRTVIPRTDLSDPTPRSWAVHPARVSRPQVAVKRADTAGPAPAPPLTPTAPAPAPLRSPAAPSPHMPLRTSPAPRARSPRPARGVRALVLVAAVLGTVLLTGLAVAGTVQPWLPAVGLAAVTLAFGWVRSAVRAEQAARSARRRRLAAETRRRRAAPPVVATGRPVAATAARATTRPPEPVASRPSGTPRPTASETSRPASAEDAEQDLTVAVASGDQGATRAESASGRTTVVAEQPADAAAPAQEVVPSEPEAAPEQVVEYVHLVDEDDIPLTWDPVPVPRPTYTLKAKADRPAVPPAAVTPDPAPVPRERADDVDERRVAGA